MLKNRITLFSCILLMGLLGLCEEGCATIRYGLIDTGYQYDRINIIEDLVDQANILNYSSSNIELKQLATYQIGFRGLWQNSGECFPLVIKGSGHYGQMLGGKINLTGDIRGRLDTGFIVDGSVGIGYCFNCMRCYEFITLVGGSYMKHHLKAKDIFDARSQTLFSTTGRATFDHSWYGPWAGFDFYFVRCLCGKDLDFDLGYEFHYGWAKCQILIPAQIRRGIMRDMKGHQFHASALYHVCQNWILGVHIAYTSWYNSHKQTIRERPLSLTPTVVDKIRYLTWRSFDVTFDIGFCF